MKNDFLYLIYTLKVFTIMKRKDKTFTMRIPSEIHEFLEKYANENFTSMSNVIVQLIMKLKKEYKLDDTK